ncbi:MAG: DUF1343 domain-containing protein, partial [Anaerolineae bacterium]|nr:DUF1343 domain-containing protein [Anaerolineae bacterium]
MMTVYPGIDALRVEGSPLLKDRRVGLLTHPAAVDRQFNSTYRIFSAARGVKLAAFFAPEHGFMGTAADGAAIATGTDARTGLPVYSLYGDTLRPTPAMLATVDTIVIDLQDVGARYYTFLWTMSHVLEAAGQHGVEVVILDRPNPLGDRIYGLPVYPEMESFVGRYNVPVAHGLTMGEMATLINTRWTLTPATLHVVRCEGWQRAWRWSQTDLPWVMTSPAMPRFSTVLHYPGACLLEGTNLSEGRGTALPFEIVGAPWLEAVTLADHLNKKRLAGVRFRPHYFRPLAGQYAGQDCQGVQAHIVDEEAFHPLHTWLLVIREIRNLYPEDFAWQPPRATPAGERYPFDLLAGSAEVRESIDDGAA